VALLVELIGPVDRERGNTESNTRGKPPHEILRAEHGLDLYWNGVRRHRVIQDAGSISVDAFNGVFCQQGFILGGGTIKTIYA